MATTTESEMHMRALLVDDEPEMVVLLRGFLRPVCSHIASTDNLRDAVEMARVGKFNLILLDLRLKDTGKEEALAAIRTLKSFNAAVLIISGLPDPHLRADALAAGADGVVEKTGDFSQHKVLLAANIAVLHLPKESFKSDTFLADIALLRQMVEAA